MKKQTKSADRPPKKGDAGSKETPSLPAIQAPRADRPFPIVGIGASAGGLEALEAFLKNVPEKNGPAFRWDHFPASGMFRRLRFPPGNQGTLTKINRLAAILFAVGLWGFIPLLTSVIPYDILIW